MESKKLSNKTIKTIIFSSTILFVFLLALILFLVQLDTTRKIFLFESLDDEQVHMEVRYLPKVENDREIQQYVDELLLGPIHDRYKPLFPQGTKTLSCFLRDRTLYIDLSEEAILQKNISSETIDGVELLKKNILKNFRNIDNVILFMMGVEVYTQNIQEQK